MMKIALARNGYDGRGLYRRMYLKTSERPRKKGMEETNFEKQEVKIEMNRTLG